MKTSILFKGFLLLTATFACTLATAQDTTDTAVAAVGGLQKRTEVAAVVWDGAPGHRDEGVRGLGMPLIGLPPYSPELNPAERVFEEVRREIEGKVYHALESKVAAVEAFLTKLEAEPERVRSLTWWDWIKAAVQPLPVGYAA